MHRTFADPRGRDRTMITLGDFNARVYHPEGVIARTVIGPYYFRRVTEDEEEQSLLDASIWRSR